MILGYAVMLTINIGLLFGVYFENAGILNIAEFTIAFLLFLITLGQFATDKQLLASKKHHLIWYMISYTLIGLTAINMIYWGYLKSAGWWLAGIAILLIRKEVLKNKTKGTKE